MKKVWKIAGIATLVAILGVATVGAVAFAQVAKEGVTSPFDFATKYREAIAGILGISVEKYDAAVEEAQKQVLDEAVTEGWLTQDQADQMQERMGQGFGAPGMGRGFPGPEMGFMGRDGNSLIGVTADKLGISVQDLMTELQGGKTIADVAKEKGVDTQTIIDAYLAQLGENLKQAVDDGKITQKQADLMLEQAKTRATDQLDETWQGFGPRDGGRRGGMKGFPGMGGWGDNLVSVAADKLGMSVQDLMTELQGGKTIADVAKEKGVDTQTIIDAYLAQLGENLKQAVDDGKITQKQADLMLEQAKTRATDQLDSTLKGTGTWQGFGHRDGGWPGGMKGFPGMGDL